MVKGVSLPASRQHLPRSEYISDEWILLTSRCQSVDVQPFCDDGRAMAPKQNRITVSYTSEAPRRRCRSRDESNCPLKKIPMAALRAAGSSVQHLPYRLCWRIFGLGVYGGAQDEEGYLGLWILEYLFPSLCFNMIKAHWAKDSYYHKEFSSFVIRILTWKGYSINLRA